MVMFNQSYCINLCLLYNKFLYFQILVNGLVRSGESLAIMGASGAGKTTLLDVLNFRNLDRFRISAKIKLNGKLINSAELISKCGYVQQDDLFIGTLTVKEHLTFLAMLKMGRYYSIEEKHARVEETLQEFNLEKCKNTYIGYSDKKKGISGGEKRRLAFASEVIECFGKLFSFNLNFF